MALFTSAGLSVALLLMLCCHSASAVTKYYVTIDWENSDYTTDLKFLSVAVGTRSYVRTEGNNPQFKVDNTRFQNLAKGLAPAGLRVGGSYANFFIFNPDGRNDPVPASVVSQWESTFGVNFTNGLVNNKWSNDEVSGYQFERVLNFTNDVGWDLIVDVNHLLQDGSVWDPSNFKLWLDYCKDNGLSIPGFQLGNENSAYDNKYAGAFYKNGSYTVPDFEKFHDTLASYPEFNSSEIIGPELTSLATSGSARTFLNEFLEAGGGNYLTAIGLHHYYFSGSSATQADFQDPDKFDLLKYLAQNATQIRDAHAPGLPIHLTETASAWSGGSTMSKTFIATFIYLDELGMAAKHGISRVYRQSFNSARYALVDSENTVPEPHPDYYLSVIFKRLMQGPVLKITCSTCPDTLRIYANCARREPYSLLRTSTVLYYVNVDDEPVNIHINGYKDREMKVFILESDDISNLISPNMTLNGNLIEMNGDEVPDMVPETMYGPNITVPANSLGFIATLQGRAEVCKDYYIEFDANN